MGSQETITAQKQDPVIRTLICEEPFLFSSLCSFSLGDAIDAGSLHGPQRSRQEHITEIY